MQDLIPLNKLQLAAANVRKTRNADADLQLSHDIEARGLLQNLIVTKAKKRGHFDVIAGGRRLAAMQMIVERGAWNADHGIECKLLAGDDSVITETSLAENFQRLAMSPAEECRAFQHFIKDDGDTQAVATRFGVTRRFVEGRLRLANLADPIFDALSNGEITLEIAKAYAATDQRDIQLRVFEQMANSYYAANPDTIRRMIADGSIRGTSAIALLVGEEAYIGAGGLIERDLFSDADEARWTNPEIAQTLAATKMETEAQRLLAETGLGWIRPLAGDSAWTARNDQNLHLVRLPREPISPEAQQRIDEIREQLVTWAEELETLENDPEAYAALEAKYDALDDERTELSFTESELPEEWKPEVGRFLLLSAKGEMYLDADLHSEKHLRVEVDDSGKISGGSFEDHSPRRSSSSKAEIREATAPDGSQISARLFDELALQRRDMLAASLLGDPALALDYAMFTMADDHMGNRLSSKGNTISATPPTDAVLRSELPDTIASGIITGAFESLDKSWAEHTGEVDCFLAFRALDDDTKAAWIAFAVARSLEAKAGYASGYRPIHATLAQTLDIQPAAMWRPTCENYFDRVKKGAMLSLLKEVGGEEFSARYASSKKGEISASCEKIFAGEAIVEDEIRERALAWVPVAMRFEPEPVDDAPAHGGEDDGDAFDDSDLDDLADPNVNDDLDCEFADADEETATCA